MPYSELNSTMMNKSRARRQIHLYVGSADFPMDCPMGPNQQATANSCPPTPRAGEPRAEGPRNT